MNFIKKQDLTFQEYLNQTDIQRRSGVIVRETDCARKFSFHGSKFAAGKFYITLDINGNEITYLVHKNNSIYTIDTDGNSVALSCFRWVD